MFRLWLRQLARRLSRTSRQRFRPKSPRRPSVEQFEDRAVPAVKTWIASAGGNWTDGTKWSGGTAPVNGDSIVIPDIGTANVADQTITFNTTVSVASIQSGEILAITGGTLTVSGSLTNSVTSTGTTSIQGGTLTLNGTNWTNAETLSLASGSFNLGGSFSTAGIGTLTRGNNGTAGTITLTGTLNNTGADLLLNAAAGGLGSWNILTGTINGAARTTTFGAWATCLLMARANIRQLLRWTRSIASPSTPAVPSRSTVATPWPSPTPSARPMALRSTAPSR